MTPTETLRAAANLLREMAQAATPGPWETYDRGIGWGVIYNGVTVDGDHYVKEVVDSEFGAKGDCHLIATLGPTFAGLVADWLDDEATGEDWLDAQLAPGLMPYVPRLPDWAPLALARHVLGEEVPQIDPTPAQERPNPANVGTGEGAPDLGALIGARETKPERPREGE